MRPPSSTAQVLRTAGRLCKRCHSTSTSTTGASSSSTSPAPPTRLRFAPSPTGHLHLGGLRTALLNHLVARQKKGKWILRIEDTDRSRYVPGTVESIRRSLDWAGLDYDEGVEVGGDYGPYYQSERLDLYNQHARQLLDSDHAYECFCTPDDLVAIKENLKAQGTQIAYDGRCRHLTDEDRARRKRAGEKYVIRFKDPGGLPDMPEDIVFGHVRPHTDNGIMNFDDFVLMKSDGFPTYHLANVVDDHYMRISHVLRGEEWLPSLPKHVQLYRAFGWDQPQFAHLPLLCAPNGSKLSKRRGDLTIDEYRAKGYEPEALLNFLALLGWDLTGSLYNQDPAKLPTSVKIRDDFNSVLEVLSLPQLVDLFDLKHLTRRKAVVNNDKLDYLQRMHLRKKAGKLGKDGSLITSSLEENEGKRELMEVFMRDLKKMDVLRDSPLLNDPTYLEKVFDANFARTTFIHELADMSLFYFLPPDFSAKETQDLFHSINESHYIRILEATIKLLPEMVGADRGVLSEDLGWELARELMSELGLVKTSRGAVFLPIRHALTGLRKGPSVPEVMVVLGEERTMSRLHRALEYAQDQKRGQNENGREHERDSSIV